MKDWLRTNALLVFGALAAAGLAMFPKLAFPQAEPVPESGTDWVRWVPMIVGGVVSVGGALGLWAWLRGKLSLLGDWLAQKTKFGALAHVDEILVAAASMVYEQGGDWLEEATADGKVTPEEWAELKQRIWDEARTMVSVDKLAPYFNGSPGAAARYVKGRVPHAVAESKARGSGAKKVSTPDPTQP